jgi:hypothetical protein
VEHDYGCVDPACVVDIRSSPRVDRLDFAVEQLLPTLSARIGHIHGLLTGSHTRDKTYITDTTAEGLGQTRHCRPVGFAVHRGGTHGHDKRIWGGITARRVSADALLSAAWPDADGCPHV